MSATTSQGQVVGSGGYYGKHLRSGLKGCGDGVEVGLKGDFAVGEVAARGRQA